jgi:hypothetical protein
LSRSVEVLLFKVEVRAYSLEVPDRTEQVDQGRKPVDRPAHHHIEPAAGVVQVGIEPRRLVYCLLPFRASRSDKRWSAQSQTVDEIVLN